MTCRSLPEVREPIRGTVKLTPDGLPKGHALVVFNVWVAGSSKGLDCIFLPMIKSAGSQGREPLEAAKPLDTAREAWEVQIAALRRLGPTGRVAVAVDLSESVRAAQLAGIEARHPEWSRADVIRHLVSTQYGIDLPRGR